MGKRQRYRLIDGEAVLRWQEGPTWEDFSRDYEAAIDVAVAEGGLSRNPMWTESIAVGGPDFTKRVMKGVKNRARLRYEEAEPGVWTVRESEEPYGLRIDSRGSKTACKGLFRPSKLT